MKYLDLYKIAEQWIDTRLEGKNKTVAVPIKHLKNTLKSEINWIEDINFWPIKCEDGDPLAHYELHGNRESRWDDDDAWVVLIPYDESLADDSLYGSERFVWAKELMHIFDTKDGQIDDEAKLKSFLYEIEIPPPPQDRSFAYWAENAALWKALLVLCPKKHRDAQKALYDADKISEYDVAAYFHISNILANNVLSDGYDLAYNRYLK